jgi:hypothetical protein
VLDAGSTTTAVDSMPSAGSRHNCASTARRPRRPTRYGRWTSFHDQLFDGRKIRVLTVVDTFTRQCDGVPVNGEPCEVAKERVATFVPPGELSGRDVVVVTNIIPVGVGRDGGSITLILKVAVPRNRAVARLRLPAHSNSPAQSTRSTP